MADISILQSAAAAVPTAYTVAGAQEIVLRSVKASFDGTSAAGSFVPALQILDPSGHEVGTYVIGLTLAAGASADVTFFPGVAPTPSTPPVGQVRLVYDFTVGTAQASIDTGVDGGFAGPFPTTLSYLEVWFTGRTDEAITRSNIGWFLNNDTTTGDYSRVAISSAVAGSPIQVQVLSGQTTSSTVAGASSNANVFGMNRLFIPNYNTTANFKMVEMITWVNNPVAGTSNYEIGLNAFLWKNTAAATRLMCKPDTVGAKIVTGSRLTIWGR